jgi:hypothetical protein
MASSLASTLIAAAVARICQMSCFAAAVTPL